MTGVKDFGWIMNVRPAILADLLRRLLVSGDRRKIVFAEKMHLHLYVDPLTFLGRGIVQDGVYEPETAEIFESELREGDVVLDVGRMKESTLLLLARWWASEG